jgi:endonuclease/exonuclease/phosphatase family metal-dependent hydrolase
MLYFHVMKKRMMILLLGAFLVAQARAQVQVRVMSYNMRYDNPDDGDNRWEIRRETLTNLLRYHAPDFIGAQELLDHQLAYVLSRLPGYAKTGVARTDGKTKGEYACIIYNSKAFRLIEEHTFWLSPYPDSVGLRGWDAALERICSYGLFEDRKSHRRFWVLNTHFDHMGQTARLESAKLIWKKIQALNKGRNLPYVLTGDLNSQPDEAPAQYLAAQLQNAREVSELVYGGIDTWENFNFKEQPKGCIDYIFLSRSPAIKVTKFATLTDSYNGKYPSDHLPVVADLLIQ